MADTPASTTGTSHDFDLSSDEEDDILQNLKQQAQRGTRSSASYDPDASSNFGKTTASSEGTPNFESMRDAFREAGMEALETKSPVAAPPTVASADESIRVDFGQAAQRQSLAHQSIASVDGVMLQSRDGGVDAVAEEPQPQTDETSVYSPPGAEEEKAPLATDATSVYSPPGASEAQPTVNTSAVEFAALAAAQEDDSESEEEEGDDRGAEWSRASGRAGDVAAQDVGAALQVRRANPRRRRRWGDSSSSCSGDNNKGPTRRVQPQTRGTVRSRRVGASHDARGRKLRKPSRRGEREGLVRQAKEAATEASGDRVVEIAVEGSPANSRRAPWIRGRDWRRAPVAKEQRRGTPGRGSTR